MGHLKRSAVLALGALLLFLQPQAAGAAPSEGDLPVVTTEQLKGMFDGGEDFLLINTLSPLEFTQTKIKGSVNIPYGHLRDGKKDLPGDKSKKLIFYCLGPK